MDGQYWANQGESTRSRTNSAHRSAAHTEGNVPSGRSIVVPSTLPRLGEVASPPESLPSPLVSHQRSQEGGTVLPWPFTYLPKCVARLVHVASHGALLQLQRAA